MGISVPDSTSVVSHAAAWDPDHDERAPAVMTVDDSIQRVERTLDQLSDLCDLVDPECQFTVGKPDFLVPETFLLSIIMPIYNERATLPEILARVARIPLRKELILVDDCSTDGTRDLLAKFACAADVHLLCKDRNEGKGAALRSGFQRARGDIVIVQDADLEYDPRDIQQLIRPILQDEADVVYGSRFLGDTRQDPSRLHRWGNALLTRASNLATGLNLTDMETCYKAIRRDLLNDIVVRQNRFGFEPEITAKLARRGCRFMEVPIAYDGRGYGDGKKIGIRDAFEALYCIFRYAVTDS